MSSHPLNPNFTRQFRQDYSVNFGTEAISHQDLLFKTFGKKEGDLASLTELLSPQLQDENMIHRLLVRLTNNDIPNVENLRLFTKGISEELLTHTQSEQYTSPYCDHVIKVLHSFLDLIGEFETEGIHALSARLTDFFTDESDTAHDSDEVADLYLNMEDYMYRLGEYFQHFHLLRKEESEINEDKSRVLVLSNVAYYLETIFNLTEKLISNTEHTLDMLHAWETALQIREEQELYN